MGASILHPFSETSLSFSPRSLFSDLESLHIYAGMGCPCLFERSLLQAYPVIQKEVYDGITSTSGHEPFASTGDGEGIQWGAIIKKLNGWQRLCLVLSGLYLCLVAVYVTLTLPTAANIPHSDTFYDQFRPELKKNMIYQFMEDPVTKELIPFAWNQNTPPTSADIEGLYQTVKRQKSKQPVTDTEKENAPITQEEWDKATPLPLNYDSYSDEELEKIAGIKTVKMPNGHVLMFPSKLPENDMTDVTQDYWRFVEKAATQKQLRYIFMALLFWAGSVIIVYVLGWSVGWVHRGFKKQ